MSDNPQIENLSRRSFLKFAIGAGATLLGIGTLEAFSPKETPQQKKAREILDNPNIPKTRWKVISKPDASSKELKKLYDQLIENGGLSVRPEPKAPLKEREERNFVLTKLEPGGEIEGIIWKGRDRTTQEEDTLTWVTYKIKDKDAVGFVSRDYLVPVQK